MLTLLGLVSTSLLADTVYVRDQLYVPLRGGESTEHRILHRGLPSGTPLTQISVNDDTGYTFVRTEDGREGYIQTQYLMSEPIAREQLDSVREELLALEARYQRTLLRLQEAETERDEIAARVEELILENDNVSTAYDDLRALSDNAVNLDAENTALKEEQDSLLAEIDALVASNADLRDHVAQQWFLRGSGVVLLGLLFGFWIARRIYHRRNTSGWS